MNNGTIEEDVRCMWTPTNIENTNMEVFRRKVNEKHSLNLGKAKLIYKTRKLLIMI